MAQSASSLPHLGLDLLRLIPPCVKRQTYFAKKTPYPISTHYTLKQSPKKARFFQMSCQILTQYQGEKASPRKALRPFPLQLKACKITICKSRGCLSSFCDRGATIRYLLPRVPSRGRPLWAGEARHSLLTAGGGAPATAGPTHALAVGAAGCGRSPPASLTVNVADVRQYPTGQALSEEAQGHPLDHCHPCSRRYTVQCG